MAIKFLSGQTISGTLTVSGNVQGATFNGLPIETSQTNNNVNKIVRTTVNGYVNFGWINSISGNHTGSITRITASNDQYLRYVTPAQFRTGVTDGFYAPSSTVTGVTSVTGTGTVSGLTLTGTVTSTGNITLGGAISGFTELNMIRSLGTTAFTNGTNPNITTAEVMAEIEADGGFDSYSSVFKTSWSYAGNYNLTDAGDFTETAGSSWITWTDNSSDTTRGNITTLAIAPNTGGSAGGVFIYNDQGSSYAPGWRQVWTSTTDGSGSGLDADLLDGQQGSYYLDWNNFTNKPTIPSVGNGQIDGRTSGLGISGSMDATANQTGNTTFTVTSNAATAATASTIAYRDSAADINVRLLRANYQNQGTISGAIAFRVNNSSDNYTRYCSDTGAIRTFLGVPASGDLGNYLPLSGGTVTGLTNLIAGSKIVVQNGTNGGASRGIFMWTNTDANWGIYMATPGATQNIAGGAAPSGLNGESSHSIRFRIASGAANGFIWENSNNATLMSMNGNSGNLTTGASMRSPIFYDSNNTAYYLDPNGTSQINTIEFVGSTNNGRFFGDTWGVKLQTDSGYILFGPANTGHAHIYTDRSNFYFNAQIQLNGGSLINTNDIRAQIFYDLNNTSYYGDFAGYSSMRGVAIRGDIGSSDIDNQIFFYGTGGSTTSAIGFKNGGQFANPTGSGDGWNTYLTMDTAGRGWVFRQGTGGSNFTSLNNSGWILNNGLWQANASMRAPIFYDSNNTAYYVDPAGTSNLNGLTVAGTITGTIETANKLAITGYQTNGQSFYQSSGSFAGFSGWHNYYIGNHGNGSNYYNTTIAFPFWGPPRYSRLEGGTFRGPYNFLTNENDQTIGVYLQSTTSLRAPIFYDYNNTAFYLDPSTTGTSVNVAGDVVAYASSDIRFKNNITPITNALDKLSKIGGYTFEWNEISHKETGKKDIGVVAQEVEEILPEIVQTRSNGYKAVDYQKLTALLIESVKEQQVIINDLKTRIETLENN